MPIDARGGEARVEPSLRRGGRAHAEVLHLTRADRRAAVGARVGVDGHELHVHEGTLARLVELRVRHHRVVPVEHLAPVGSRGGSVAAGAAGDGIAPWVDGGSTRAWRVPNQ